MNDVIARTTYTPEATSDIRLFEPIGTHMQKWALTLPLLVAGGAGTGYLFHLVGIISSGDGLAVGLLVAVLLGRPRLGLLITPLAIMHGNTQSAFGLQRQFRISKTICSSAEVKYFVLRRNGKVGTFLIETHSHNTFAFTFCTDEQSFKSIESGLEKLLPMRMS